MTRLCLPLGYTDEQVVYYFDANFFIDQKDAYELIAGIKQPRLLTKVIMEIATIRPDQKSDLDRQLSRSVEVDVRDSTNYFLQSRGLPTFRLLQHCSSAPPHELRHADFPRFDNGDPQGWRTTLLNYVERVRQRKMNETNESVWHLTIEDVEHQIRLHDEMPCDLVADVLKRSHKRSMKAYSQYYRALTNKLASGQYYWTDEDIYASAATEAFLGRTVAVVVTADKGFEVIAKQLVDNLIYEYCNHYPARRDLTFSGQYQFEMDSFVEYQYTRESRDSRHGIVVDTAAMRGWEKHLWENVLIGKPRQYWFKEGDLILFDWKNNAANGVYSFLHQTFPRHLIRFANSLSGDEAQF